MKGVVYDRFGAPEMLHLADVPMPELRPDDLLVRVAAAGVNRADLMQREGFYGDRHFGESALLGLELAGEVVATGCAVTAFRPGERVMAIVGGGAYAAFARVDQGMAARVPDGVSLVDAGAIMESFVTAWEAASHLAALAPGESVLVHAAAGGVGSAVVQVAHALGARVYATAPASRLDAVRGIGAAMVFDYRTEDFEARIREETDGRGVDAVIDFVGGAWLARNLRSLRPGGRLVQVGILSGEDDAVIPLNLLLHNHLRLIGTVMKSRTVDEKRAMIRRFAEGALPLFAQGTLRPLVYRVFPFAQAAAAHAEMERGGGFGKILLTAQA
ncbi:NAD(P)H-quinone oxidoreductase [Nguyenibacter vanlangensis]|uniref:NAD(P)H-quinone oxidoreductase n=1 Tax=Nguyenibacter vanlangensis TaxID=1216886 RepID=A0A7Y7IUW3_9PROT|nr:NAD(P)H-quinone oxidoreductase [Nguyenibacter vanlangensis]NVN10201.1 NAD(P)H-quinone oxidoreductase [Nguyenibacter vanlangensis]